MNIFRQNMGLIITAVICIAVFVVLVILMIRGLMGGGAINELRLIDIVPEKTTEKMVLEKYGNPSATEKNKNINSLFYNSPLQYQYDSILSRNGVVLAVLERLPEKTNKKVFLNELGGPEDTLFDSEIPDDFWLTYYSKGIAIKTAGEVAYSVLRFDPQPKEAFIENIMPLTSISLQKTEYEGEELDTTLAP